MSTADKAGTAEARSAGANSFWAKHGDNVVLALLVIYVILLGIGTVAELFDIRSILSWPIYR
jgi:hypothetical protein